MKGVENMRYLLDKINELAYKEKVSGLTEDEKLVQAQLRKKYAGLFRSSMEHVLLNTTIIDPSGADVTPSKLQNMKQWMNEASRPS